MGREVYESPKLLGISGNQAVCNVSTCESMEAQPNPAYVGCDSIGMFSEMGYWLKEYDGPPENATGADYENYDYYGGYKNHGIAGYGINVPCSSVVYNYVPFNLAEVKKKSGGKAVLVRYEGKLNECNIEATGTSAQLKALVTKKLKEGSWQCYFIVANSGTALIWGQPKVMSSKPKEGLVPIYVYTVEGNYHM